MSTPGHEHDINNHEYHKIVETSQFLIINKTSPISVLPDKRGNLSLKEIIFKRENCDFLEAPHRLDARTSGLVVFCKTRESLSCMGKLFQHGLVNKTYWVVVENKGILDREHGILRHRLYHDERSNKTYAKSAGPGTSRDCVELRWLIRGTTTSHVLLEVVPLQGKTHQIRAQLAATGLPIAGDAKYGSKYHSTNGLILLHAVAIEFPCKHDTENAIATIPSDARTCREVESEAMKLFSGVVSCRADPPESEPLWSQF